MASSHANWPEVSEMLPAADPQGVNRIYSTLQAAIDAAEDSADQIIYIADGHTETVTAAAGLDLNKIGLTIVGLGKGDRRPTINFTTVVGADMDVDAEGITIENCIFDLTGIDTLTAPIDVNAANFTLRKCHFITGDAAGQTVLGILTDANANGMLIEDCTSFGTSDAGTTSLIRIVGGDNIVIRNNHFTGYFTTTTGPIQTITTAPTNLRIEGNVLRNLTAASTKVLDFVAQTEATVVNNRLYILSGTAPVDDAGSGGGKGIQVGGNYYTAASAVAAGTLL